MHLPRSAALVPRLETVDHTDSTNDDLTRLATGPTFAGGTAATGTGSDADAWPDLSVLVTDDQRAGRGRLGRRWVAPAGSSLAISVLLRPVADDGTTLPIEAYGWLPLLAGLAMARAVQSLGADARVKWPNDVLIGGRKVCGILAELLPMAAAPAAATPMAPAQTTARQTAAGQATVPRPAGAVVGAGVNLTIERDDLPVETATSLRLEGIPNPEPDAVLSAYLTELTALYRGFLAAGGDPAVRPAGAPASSTAEPAVRPAGAPASSTADPAADPAPQPPTSLRDAVRAGCETIGRAVRIQLPAGPPLVGTAVDIDVTGRLVVETNGRRTAVSAGDVTHLRY